VGQASGAIDDVNELGYLYSHRFGRFAPGYMPAGYGDHQTDSGAATPGSVSFYQTNSDNVQDNDDSLTSQYY